MKNKKEDTIMGFAMNNCKPGDLVSIQTEGTFIVSGGSIFNDSDKIDEEENVNILKIKRNTLDI